MTRPLVAAVLALSFCGATQADVTLRATSTGQGAGMSGQTSSVTYIKGLKMRTEATAGKFSTASIYDIDAQKL